MRLARLHCLCFSLLLVCSTAHAKSKEDHAPNANSTKGPNYACISAYRDAVKQFVSDTKTANKAFGDCQKAAAKNSDAIKACVDTRETLRTDLRNAEDTARLAKEACLADSAPVSESDSNA